jgi:hypothetical protein
MNTSNTLKQLTEVAVLAALGLMLSAGLCGSRAHAASIRLETKVAGYSSAGWILVLPELRAVLGGRVSYDRSRGCWVTDRVQRGELMRVTVSPNTPAEFSNPRALFGVYTTTGWQIFDARWVNLPFSTTGTVPWDPSFRDVVVVVENSAYAGFEKVVPIGTRP